MSSKTSLNALQKYLLDIKPYHTKLKELRADYIFEDQMAVTFIDELPFTKVNLQNCWGKDDVGGWRLSTISDGSQSMKTFRLPATIIPRYSLNTGDIDHISVPPGYDPATPSNLGGAGAGVPAGEIPWFGTADADSWLNNFTWSHQLGSDTIPYEIPLLRTQFVAISFSLLSATKIRVLFFTINYLDYQFGETVLGYDFSVAPTCKSYLGITQSYTYDSGLKTAQHINSLVDIDFSVPGQMTLEKPNFPSGVFKSRTVSISHIFGYEDTVAEILTGVNTARAKAFLQSYVSDFETEVPSFQYYIENSRTYRIPFHSGLAVRVTIPEVSTTDKFIGTHWLPLANRDGIIFIDGQEPSPTDEIRFGIMTVDRLSLSYNIPFVSDVATSYDNSRYDMTVYDSYADMLVPDSDTFTLTVTSTAPRYTLSFHDVSIDQGKKGHLTKVSISDVAPLGEIWTIKAITPIKFTVVGSLSGEVSNIHPYGGTTGAVAIYGKPFDNGLISFTIENKFSEYFITLASDSYLDSAADPMYAVYLPHAFPGTKQPLPYLEITHDLAGVAPNKYLYQKISEPMYTIAIGDRLVYDFFASADNPAITGGIGGIEIDFTTGAPANGRSASLVDTLGDVLVNLNGSGAHYVGDVWYRRDILLSPVAGKIISAVDLVTESNVVGSYLGRYRNIRILDASDAIKLVIWDHGPLAINEINYSVDASNIEVTDHLSDFDQADYFPNLNVYKEYGSEATGLFGPRYFEPYGYLKKQTETNPITGDTNQAYYEFEFDVVPPLGTRIEFRVDQWSQFNEMVHVAMSEHVRFRERLSQDQWVDLVERGYDDGGFDSAAFDGFTRNPDGTLATGTNEYQQTGIVEEFYYKTNEDLVYYLGDGTAGCYLRTVDTPANSITYDLDIRIDLSLNDWSPTLLQAVYSKYTAAGNQLCYYVGINSLSQILFETSQDGATRISAASPTILNINDGDRIWIRVAFDTNDGLGNNIVYFYTSTDGILWTLIGSTTRVGTYALFNSTAPIIIGGYNGVGAFTGKIYQALLFDGIDGTLISNFAPAVANVGNTNFVGVTGETWIHNGTSSIALTVAPAKYTRNAYIGIGDYFNQGSWVTLGPTTINGVNNLVLYHTYAQIPQVDVKVAGISVIPDFFEVDEARIRIGFDATTEFEVFVYEYGTLYLTDDNGEALVTEGDEPILI